MDDVSPARLDLGIPGSKLSERLFTAARLYNQVAQSFNAEAINSAHLLLSFLRQRSAVEALGVTYDACRRVISENSPLNDMVTVPIVPLAPCSLRAFQAAAAIADRFGQEKIGSAHLLLALIETRPNTACLTLSRLKVPLDVIERRLTADLTNGSIEFF